MTCPRVLRRCTAATMIGALPVVIAHEQGSKIRNGKRALQEWPRRSRSTRRIRSSRMVRTAPLKPIEPSQRAPKIDTMTDTTCQRMLQRRTAATMITGSRHPHGARATTEHEAPTRAQCNQPARGTRKGPEPPPSTRHPHGPSATNRLEAPAWAQSHHRARGTHKGPVQPTGARHPHGPRATTEHEAPAWAECNQPARGTRTGPEPPLGWQ